MKKTTVDTLEVAKNYVRNDLSELILFILSILWYTNFDIYFLKIDEFDFLENSRIWFIIIDSIDNK